MTPAQRWRFRRNLVIYIASKAGINHSILSDVFTLARSRVTEIILKTKAIEEEYKAGPPDETPKPTYQLKRELARKTVKTNKL